MTGKELFEIWAPHSSVWSQWVSPALFAQIDDATGSDNSNLELPNWVEGKTTPHGAVIIDLPGAESVRVGLALAERGYRPVPIINASPGPLKLQLTSLTPADRLPGQLVVVLDMSSLIKEICSRTPRLRELTFFPEAPPAFMLDSLRLKGTNPLQPNMFDNRWMVFPQDFPSSGFLAKRNIRRVTLVQERKTQPQEDLAHVLLRWQEAGIEIFSMSIEDHGAPSRIAVARPSRFKTSWYRALAILGLRRSSAGGFGSFIPETSAGG